MKRIVARIRTFTTRWSRDLLAIAGILGIAIGLGGVAWQLGPLSVGLYLLFASGAGRSRSAG